MQLKNKIQHSISLIKKYENIALQYNDFGYHLAFSGGKDSQVIHKLAKMSGVKFKAFFYKTSVDPRELLSFIRSNYPDVEWLRPKMTMYQLIIKKGMLPLRQARFCCEYLKERNGVNAVVMTGITAAESAKRAKRKEHEHSCIKGQDKIFVHPIKKRVVILARVSTAKQETVNQLLQLREFCLNNNFEIVQEITENVSGNTADRKGIQLVISLASQKKFDLLLFWNLDRFSRLGISQTLHYFELLEGFGIQIKSFTQPYLDTSNSVIRELLLAFFSYMANFQLKRYSEDIKAGQQRAIAAGKRIGRPHIPSDAIKVIRSLKNDNYSNRAIAAQLNINEKTVRNYLKSF